MFKKSVFSILLSITPVIALATPYQVLMDDVESANWAPMHDGVGDLYDAMNVKQVDVTYTVKTTFGAAGTLLVDDPQFWEAAEYGDFHKAIFAPQGGSDVLEIEISGLNGHLIDLTQVVMGRWFPDGTNTLATDWKVFDDQWNEIFDATTVMTDYIDYSSNLNLGSFSTLRFQMGHDNWDNGVIAFTYDTDVENGVLDLRRDDISAPTPDITPTPVPAPATLALFVIGLGMLRIGKRARS